MDEKYKKYLASDEWKAKRDERMRMDRYLCTDCGSPWNLVVHHIRYDNVYHEKMDDLATLCRRCHKAIHGKNNGGEFDPDTFWWNDIYEQSYHTPEMSSLLISVGGPIAILGYILKNKDEDNRLRTFLSSITKDTGTSRNIALSTLNKFQDNNLIVFERERQRIDIFVNPQLGIYGGEDRKQLLLSEYYSFKREKMKSIKKESEEPSDADN